MSDVSHRNAVKHSISMHDAQMLCNNEVTRDGHRVTDLIVELRDDCKQRSHFMPTPRNTKGKSVISSPLLPFYSHFSLPTTEHFPFVRNCESYTQSELHKLLLLSKSCSSNLVSVGIYRGEFIYCTLAAIPHLATEL